MPALKNSQSGFTLVELLIAVVILAVGLLGLAQLQIKAVKTNAQSSSSTAATAIAQKVVEEIAAKAADDPMFDVVGVTTWPGGPIDVEGAGSYTVTYEVSPVLAGASTVTNVLNIEVTVTSTADVMHVLRNQVREAKAFTIKRVI